MELRLGGGGFGEVASALFMSLWSSATLR